MAKGLEQFAGLPQPRPRLLGDERASTTLEWSLLLAAIALPSYFIIRLALDSLVGYYQMMTVLNSLPFP